MCQAIGTPACEGPFLEAIKEGFLQEWRAVLHNSQEREHSSSFLNGRLDLALEAAGVKLFPLWGKK